MCSKYYLINANDDILGYIQSDFNGMLIFNKW